MKKRYLSLLLCLAVSASLLVTPAAATSQLTNLNTSYTLTGNPAADIVNVAVAQVGKTGSQLSAKENWCADFVFTCARAAGIGTDVIPTTGGVTEMYNGVLSRGGKVVSSPQTGDLVFYNPQGNQHVGIMMDSVNSVHGNMGTSGYLNSQVKKCLYYDYTGSKNYVFVRPNYSSGNADTGSNNPDVPTMLGAFATGTNVLVSWIDVKNETGYDVYLVQSPWYWESIKYSGHVGANVTDYTFTGVTSGEYCAFVIARPNTNSMQSQWARVSVKPTVTVVTGEAKDVTETGAILYGTAETDGAGIYIYGMYVGTSRSDMKKAAIIGVSAKRVNITYNTPSWSPLSPGTLYYYQAFAEVDGIEYTGDVKTFSTPISIKSNTTPTYYLDLNGILDGERRGNIAGYGTADIYVNGTLVAASTTDYYELWPSGTTYEVKNIRANEGFFYDDAASSPLYGTIGSETANVRLSFSKIPAHKHTLTHIPAKAATCTEAGNIEYWYCADCGKYFSDADAANEITRAQTVTAALGHSYVDGVCIRDGAVDPNYTKPAAGVSLPKQTHYFQGQFSDVPAEQWFTGSVASAVEFGLMRGDSGSTFNPYGDVTLAEAITMAARINSIYNTGAESFDQSVGSAWYQTYLDYAYDNGIINRAYYNADVTRKATRAQFAEIFANSLPEAALAAINSVADNVIPDVSMSVSYAPYVYRLYRAGVLTGGDAKGTFSPQTYITRAEAAAIVSRMAESDNRVSFTLQ